MKVLELIDEKTNLSSILKDVEAGIEVAIASGEDKEKVAVVIPYEQWRKTRKRQIGTLEGKMSLTFADDWYMSDEELINL